MQFVQVVDHGLRGYVHRCHHLARGGVDRGGQRPQTRFELLVHDGEALLADAGNLGAQLFGLHDRRGGVGLEVDLGEVRVEFILGQAREARDEAEAGEPKVDMTAEERREARRTAAAHRKNLAPLRKRAQAAEQLLQRLNAEHRRIADALAKPSIYDGPKDKLAELLRVQGELEKRIAETESDWLEAEAALEEAS